MEQPNPLQSINTTDEKPASQIAQVHQVWSEIQVAYERGDTWKSIHARLEGSRIRMSYKNFLTYVSRVRREHELGNPDTSPNAVRKRAMPSDCDSAADVAESQPASDDRGLNPIQSAAPIPDNVAQKVETQANDTVEQEDAGKSSYNAVSNGPAIHLFLQRTRGVGNSLMASILAQYLTSRGQKVNCIDADRMHPTLSQYRQLEVQRLDLMRDNGIRSSALYDLMQAIPTGDQSVIVDFGSLTFIRLWPYIVERSIFQSLGNSGRRLFIHIVIAGGSAQEETLLHFRCMAERARNQSIVVWINSHFGPVERDGKSFMEMSEYREHAPKVIGVIAFNRTWSLDTFSRDIEAIFSQRETFAEAMMSPSLRAMNKQRLKIVKNELFEQLDRLELAAPPTDVPPNDDYYSHAAKGVDRLWLEIEAIVNAHLKVRISEHRRFQELDLLASSSSQARSAGDYASSQKSRSRSHLLRSQVATICRLGARSEKHVFTCAPTAEKKAEAENTTP